MSHELRTPLNAIIGFAQVLHEGIGVEKPSERQRDYMKDIDQAGRHLLGIISEILDIAKIESGSFELDIEEYELAEILSDCTRLVAERFTGKKQRLVIDLEPGLPNVRIDGRRVKQVLLNLLSNAHKFTPESGRVDLIARRTPAGGADIVVRDTGIGMSPEGLMLAMRPFGQVQSAYSRSHDGTGLGLPIAKGLVELHGGKLEMTSQPGVGTSVRVRLPPDCIAPHAATGLEPASPRKTN
jgi:two-component system cell cycle sensor histidine kinase PleC